MASNLLEGKVFVKISELDATVGFAAEDEFVLVQNGVTLKTTGLDITDSVISIGNLADKPYVESKIIDLIGGAPGILDTLNELATALNDDANFAGTITTIVNTKLASGDFGLRFWEELAQVNTYHIAEGINLYWTQERFDTALAAKNTFHITEGSNLYFTEQRVHDVLDSIPPPPLPNRLVNGEYEIVLGSDGVLALSMGSNIYDDGGALRFDANKNIQLSAYDNGTPSTWTFGTDGKLTLPAEPTSADHAATKGYVDSQTSAIESFSGSYDDLTDKPTAPTYNSVIVSGPITNPNHTTTKAYVDWKVSSIPTPSWNSIANISNNLGPTRIALGRNAGGVTDAGGYGGYGGYGAYGGSSFAIAIGNSSGRTNQGGAAVSIGVATGYIDQGENAVAVGFTAGSEYQGLAAVAVGESAGRTSQGNNSVAIGHGAGAFTQGGGAVAIGSYAGSDTQGENAVAIGVDSGINSQGNHAVAIGWRAGNTNQPAGSIVINASGNELNGSVAGLYIDPIRNAEPTYYIAYYDPETKEITYGPVPSGAGGPADRLVNGEKEVTLQSDGYITLVNGAQLYDYGSGTGNGYGITDAANSTYIGYDPSDTLGALHMDSYSGGNIRIRTTTLPNTYKDWLFDNAGVLSIPTGGDIKQNGVSVLGGGATPTFTSVTTTNLNVQNVTLTGVGPCTFTSGNDLNFVAAGTIKFNGSEIVEKTTGSWTLAAGANTVGLTVPGPGTYSIWVNGNIPNGIVTYTATVVVTNTNVPVVGSSYGWYYAAGNALVLTAIPNQIVGTANSISNAVVSTTTANVFTFGITNNSGSNQVVNWGYSKL